MTPAERLPTEPADNQRPLYPHRAVVDGCAVRKADPELFIRQAFGQSPEKGYALLFKRYYQPLCSHAARFVYARDTAEDLVVDVFAQFWQQRLDQSVTTSFRAYLFTMVRHRAFAQLRSEFGREISTDSLPETDYQTTLPSPLQVLQYNELYLKINETIRSASPHSQQVFVMSRFEGRKNTEIAQELNISVKTVEGHITKMLALLRRVLRAGDLLLVLLWLSTLATTQGLMVVFSLLGITQLIARL